MNGKLISALNLLRYKFVDDGTSSNDDVDKQRERERSTEKSDLNDTQIMNEHYKRAFTIYEMCRRG